MKKEKKAVEQAVVKPEVSEPIKVTVKNETGWKPQDRFAIPQIIKDRYKDVHFVFINKAKSDIKLGQGYEYVELTDDMRKKLYPFRNKVGDNMLDSTYCLGDAVLMYCHPDIKRQRDEYYSGIVDRMHPKAKTKLKSDVRSIGGVVGDAEVDSKLEHTNK